MLRIGKKLIELVLKVEAGADEELTNKVSREYVIQLMLMFCRVACWGTSGDRVGGDGDGRGK